MNIVSANNVSYDYVYRDENDNITEKETALNNLNIEIKEGSFTCLLGANGSGKSTFARLINALNIPSSGTILVSGMDTKDEENVLKIRETAGMVFQNPDNQIISNVVEEDIGFGPENMGIPTEEINERVNEAISILRLNEFRYKAPGSLSGGQKQRVAIAGIMAMKPKCIILDEPTAMLDPNGRKEVLAAIHRLNKEEGITIIFITHYMEEAIDADRIIIMDHGKVAIDDEGQAIDGTPREVFSKVQDLRRLGLSVPLVTELAYMLRKDGFDIALGILKDEELIEAIREFYPGENND